MGWEEDARCILPVTFAADSLAALHAMLDPNNVMHAGCEVKKHPDCCVLCVLNNDCSRLPVHIRCRCVPEVTLGLSGRLLDSS